MKTNKTISQILLLFISMPFGPVDQRLNTPLAKWPPKKKLGEAENICSRP
ncbi:MAG: hypothetical protein CM15mP58_19060 [Burkholderiaceae bacterium]|nr:MAG: hypothetical protein CM15mP58_19060 [Burkholderiaceae bacterium]